MFDPTAQNPLPEEFDTGVGYTVERGGKRRSRIQASRDQTAVARSQVSDNKRTLTFNVAQQFVSALLAKSTLEFAKEDLASFQRTVDISEARYKAGDISENDFLRIKLQLLQFQTDVSFGAVVVGTGAGHLHACRRTTAGGGGHKETIVNSTLQSLGRGAESRS